MGTIDTYSPLMSAKPDQVGDLRLKISKTTSSLDDFEDLECYRQSMTSPRVRVYDTRLIDSSSVDFGELMANAVQQDALMKQESGRRKLEKHRTEVAGRVCIPEKWGQENFLKDWMNYSLFDSWLAPKGVVSAREALVAESRRESSRCLKMESRS